MAASPTAPRPPTSGPPADGDSAAAPMEAGPQLSTPRCSPPSHPPAVEDDFKFILCERCQQASPNLKLLTCLHTLCLGCLSENKPIGQCPVCRTPIPQASGIPDMDNLLFTNLQARLSIYKKIVDSGGASCSRCRGEAAAVWCPECEEFLCAKCFEDHQWFFKKRNHEARKVEDLRAESPHQFLEDTRKSCNLFCANPGHTGQDHISSIYCTKCEKVLCCSCALLDSQHAPFCDIRSETQRRQQELSTIAQELEQKRSRFQATQAVLRNEAARLEETQRKMRELIQQRVEQLVQLLRREEEELLGLVEAQQERGRRELAGELQRMEGTLRRMEAAERLVEKMNLYATEQEVMDMQPFIRDSLQELQRLQPPATGEREQPRDLSECRARLQALVERVTGHPALLPLIGISSKDDNKDDNTLILDLEPPRELCQLNRGHHQCPDQGGDMSCTQPTLPALLMQRDEEAEEDHGDTVPPPRSLQDSVASLQEDFSGWARSNIQQVDKFLKMGNRLLQAQQRANRHLVSVTWEIQALSRSLATIVSALRPLLQPVATPVDVPTADVDWTLLELVPPSTVQRHEPLVSAAAATPGPSRPPPATSPARSETPSPGSEGECPKSRHPSRSKRGGKPSVRLQKRRKK